MLQPLSMDLPKLLDRPSFEVLREALEGLAIKPTSWSNETTESSEPEDIKEVNNYLLSIISSGLRWLEVDADGNDSATDAKEVLWDLASKRMAERCGRTAMPEMTRTWVIPGSKNHPELKFHVREPPLTGDNLGLKTWGTAFAISKKLEEFGTKYFSHLIDVTKDYFTTEIGSNLTMPKMRVLELGSGTGLVGIAVAAIWRVAVVLTDLPEIHENLSYNVHQNSATINEMGGSATCTVLDWKRPEMAFADFGSHQFEAVIAADPLYDDEHPDLVADMIKKYLRHNRNSRALVAVPLRDNGTKALVRNLIQSMKLNGFQLTNQGEELFKDDWADANEEGVICWWSIWSWNVPWPS